MKPLYYTYIGDREKNEDRFFIKSSKEHNYEFYGVLDGHSGSQVAEYCAKYIVKNFEKHIANVDFNMNLSILDNTIKQLFENLFLRCQYNLILKYNDYDFKKSGTTLCCIFIKNNNAWVANCGDSRVILTEMDFNTIQVTKDHNFHNIYEKTRIVVQGGWYDNRYLFGKINTTRGLGDLWQLKKMRTENNINLPPVSIWKNIGLDTFDKIYNFFDENNIEWFISPIPEIYSIRNINNYLYFFIATDGVWTVMNTELLNNNITDIILNSSCTSHEDLKRDILQKILIKWDNSNKLIDNITFILKFIPDIFTLSNKKYKNIINNTEINREETIKEADDMTSDKNETEEKEVVVIAKNNHSDEEDKDSDVEDKDSDVEDKDSDEEDKDSDEEDKDSDEEDKDSDEEDKDSDEEHKDSDEEDKDSDEEDKDSDEEDKDSDEEDTDSDEEDKDSDEEDKDSDEEDKDSDEEDKDSDEEDKDSDEEDKDSDEEDKEDKDSDEEDMN